MDFGAANLGHCSAVCKAAARHLRFPLAVLHLRCCCSALFPTEPSCKRKKRKMHKKNRNRRQGSQRQGSASGSSTSSSSTPAAAAAAAAESQAGQSLRRRRGCKPALQQSIRPPVSAALDAGPPPLPARNDRPSILACTPSTIVHLLLSVSRRDYTISLSTLCDASTLAPSSPPIRTGLSTAPHTHSPNPGSIRVTQR